MRLIETYSHLDLIKFYETHSKLLVSPNQQNHGAPGLKAKMCSTILDYYTNNLRNGPCLACIYQVMDARGKLGEHERSV